MPFVFDSPVSREVPSTENVDVTEARIVDVTIVRNPAPQLTATWDLGTSSPFTVRDTLAITFTSAQTLNILTRVVTGGDTVVDCIERSIYQELADLGRLPPGTFS